MLKELEESKNKTEKTRKECEDKVTIVTDQFDQKQDEWEAKVDSLTSQLDESEAKVASLTSELDQLKFERQQDVDAGKKEMPGWLEMFLSSLQKNKPVLKI